MSKLRKALEKAKAARQRLDDNYIAEVQLHIPVTHDTAEKNQMRSFEKVNPVYQQTRIQHVDFQRLEENRVISSCIDNMVADRLKILRTQVLEHIKEAGGNTLLIASPNPGEGRTITAINLSISLAQQIDGTVLLVDADLRKPSIHNLLGLEVKRGLSDYLRGKADIQDLMINPGIPRLVVLPGGKAIANSSELLGSPRMQWLIKEMKERYDDRFIIFDSPPLLTNADTLVLSRYVDGILMVVEAEKTKKDDIKQAIELLKERPIIGTIFNKTK